MRIILLKDIKALGRKNEIKNVSDGYARNFLIPKKFASLATSKSIKILEKNNVELEKDTQEFKKLAEKIKKSTESSPLQLYIKVGDNNEIFGSIAAEEIEKKLIELFPDLKNTKLKIGSDHIRELGIQNIEIDLGKGIREKIKIEVKPQ
jgi:large subunit ribosomal protein L9